MKTLNGLEPLFACVITSAVTLTVVMDTELGAFLAWLFGTLSGYGCLVLVTVFYSLVESSSTHASERENSDDSAFSAPEADENGKTYIFFRLIKEGEYKGSYEPNGPFIKVSSISRAARDAEFVDIISSGFGIHAPEIKKFRSQVRN